jgi:Type II CAAX prenyl endopeptidase Rce1-like
MASDTGGQGGTAAARGFALAFGVLLLFTLALMAMSFPAGWYTFFLARLSPTYDGSSLLSPYLYLGPVRVTLPVVLSFGALFALCNAVYLAMFAFAAVQGRRPLAALSASVREGAGSLFASPFFATLISIGFLIFTASLIDVVVSGTAPVPDPLVELLGLTYAPLVEELGFRVLLVGTVAALAVLVSTRRDILRSLWRPSAAYEADSGGGVVQMALAVMVVASAVVFGATHVTSGWTSGKFFEAMYGGLVLGYVYVKYGFHVAVLTHWGIDYFGQVFWFFGQVVAGISWDSTTSEYILQQIVDVDLFFLFGLACFVLVVYAGLKKLLVGRERGRA